MSTKQNKKKSSKNHYVIVSNDGYARGYMAYAALKGKAPSAQISVSGLITEGTQKPDSASVRVVKAQKLSVDGFAIKTLSNELLKSASNVLALSQENANYLRNTYTFDYSRMRVLDVAVLTYDENQNYENALKKIESKLQEIVC